MEVLLAVTAWLVIGAVVGVVQARRGHWHGSWVVMAITGPLAIGLARAGREREATATPTVLHAGERRVGGVLDVLVGIDGSPASAAAAQFAANLFGSRMRRLTLAAVLDFDTAEDDDRLAAPSPERDAARTDLESIATVLAAEDHHPTTVVLAGEPADALQRYARRDGYDLIVIGSRGGGMSKVVLGSCAMRLARHSDIPVLLVPPDAVDGKGDGERATAVSR